MKKSNNSKLVLKGASLLFAIVAVLHLARIVAGWDLNIDGTLIPISVSAIAVVVTAFLSYHLYRISEKK